MGNRTQNATNTSRQPKHSFNHNNNESHYSGGALSRGDRGGDNRNDTNHFAITRKPYNTTNNDREFNQKTKDPKTSAGQLKEENKENEKHVNAEKTQ